MADTYQYILSLNESVSPMLQLVAGVIDTVNSQMTALAVTTQVFENEAADLGSGLLALNQNLTVLEKQEILSSSNIRSLQQHKKQIQETEYEYVDYEEIVGQTTQNVGRQIASMDNAGKSGLLSKYFDGLCSKIKDMFDPLAFVQKAMAFDMDMAKLNMTAKLDEKGLEGLQTKLRTIAKDNSADVVLMPTGFEEILTQTGNIDTSLQILDASLKGSKAGFEDLGSVSDALSKTLVAVGSEQAGAQDVLDTFMAVKRVGAGNFKDFAQYMPSLIAGAADLGVGYKDVAGMFAYMTGKGKDATGASKLMQSMFAELGKTDITQNLEQAGVKILDARGKMRGVVDVFGDLNNAMSGMDDESKTAFLRDIGISGEEARRAIISMESDLGALSGAMEATANATGETVAALENSDTPMRSLIGCWNDFNTLGLDLGKLMLPLFSAALVLLELAISGVSFVLGHVASICSDWFGALKEGNPWIWALTAALGGLTIALAAYEIITNKAAIATKFKTIWDSISAGWMSIMTVAQWLYNTSLFGCPLVWIVALIALLVGAIVACCTKVQGWGKQWQVIVDFMKNCWDLFVETFKFRWNLLTNGFMIGLDKIRLGWYKFKEAVGLGDSEENQAMIAGINTDMENRKQAIVDGAKKIKDMASKTVNSLSWELSGKEDKEAKPETPQVAPPTNLPPVAGMPELGTTVNLPAFENPVEMPGGIVNNIPQSSAGQSELRGSGNTEKNNWLKTISADLEKITAANAPVLANLQQIAATAAAVLAFCNAIETRTPDTSFAPLLAGGQQMPPVEVPAVPLPETSEFSTRFNGQNTYESGNGRSVYFDKYCDQVVINVQNTDERGTGEIEAVIKETLTHIFDNYEV